MHTWVEINRAAIVSNFLKLREISGDSTLMPVLKSNAYGHGLEQVYDCLKDLAGLEWIAVNYLFEAHHLRKLGFQGDILVVGPVFEKDLHEAKELKTTVFLSHWENLDHWLSLPEKPLAHLKFDTGMGRQGFLPEETKQILAKIDSQSSSFIRGFATHFANVEDVTVHEYARLQLARFLQVQEVATDMGYADRLFHSASSASTMLLPDSRFGLCRTGISLYGFWPSAATKLSYLSEVGESAELQPALTWKTKVAQVKIVREGGFIGYGCTYRAPKDMKVAILPVGYYEGYMRSLGEKNSYVLIKDSRCSVLGRICMNMLMVDVSHLKEVSVGEEVVLLGRSRAEELSASQVAEWAGTIHYEMTTQIHAEIPRILL